LKDILNDVNMYFSPDGLRILTLDTARVALVDMFLPSENFEEFQSETLVAGVNVCVRVSLCCVSSFANAHL
jgi:proliferating cell nuclear antigen